MGVNKYESGTESLKAHNHMPSIWKSIKKNRFYYFLILPGLLYFIIFHYIPMFGIIIAFRDVSPYDGIHGILTSPWVGLKYFIKFTQSYYFWDILKNTVVISLYKLVCGFPAPIIFALLLNEVTNMKFKKAVQTISYLPHFLSMVVMVGIIQGIFSTQGGLLNQIIGYFGGNPIFFLGDVRYFRSILVVSDIWKNIGFGSILYLAAISGIDIQLYESSFIDGANKWKQMWHITLPNIRHIIVILLIFSIGGLLNAGFEQILLLYSPQVYDVADIIDTYVYREGLVGLNYSYTTAIGMFKSVIALLLIITANFLSKKFDQEGIW